MVIKLISSARMIAYFLYLPGRTAQTTELNYLSTQWQEEVAIFRKLFKNMTQCMAIFGGDPPTTLAEKEVPNVHLSDALCSKIHS